MAFEETTAAFWWIYVAEDTYFKGRSVKKLRSFCTFYRRAD